MMGWSISKNMVLKLIAIMCLSLVTFDLTHNAVKHEVLSKVEICLRFERCKLLTELAYHEARGESDKGVAAVVHVVLNRVNWHKQFPDDVFGVVHQHKQFSYLSDGSVERGMKDEKQVERVAEIVYNVLIGDVEDVTDGSLFYHSVSIKPPSWAKKKKVVAEIGRHTFYK